MVSAPATRADSAGKSYDTRWMAELIKPYLKPDGVVVGMQNGMNDDTILHVE